MNESETAKNIPEPAAPRRAVALISGGLDSMLAVRVMQQQGIYVEGINFYTGFCVEGHTQAIRTSGGSDEKRNSALWVADQLGIRLHIIDVIEAYKPVLLAPRHGYGSNLNPCLDCKIFMLKKAKEWLEANGFDFIITGEVVGQRPMSQLAAKLRIISKKTELEDLLVRPLSGKHLPETLPEREGWIKREGLYDFNGRSRKPQIALARAFGFSDWSTPAGGCCFLTDENYSRKLRDLWQAQGERRYELDDIMLLKVGRHLRPLPEFKLLIGRDEGESNFLYGYRKQFITLDIVSHNGPITLIDGTVDATTLHLAARIAARYSQGHASDSVVVNVRRLDGSESTLMVVPLPKDEVNPAWMI
ncbi:MAG: tRNA (5-methylaminomethyl-2-thiouridylate)-methyltransferase [Gammaproteobacteria bacterium]|nr:tRNA (5-methylaminomethyl-2-thiouridylate)-methyltransferase [Gammaproteobacteria bacterium]